jgi:hypothetical protein
MITPETALVIGFVAGAFFGALWFGLWLKGSKR